MPWITVHPVYEKGDGRHVLISGDGTILAGMGGKFNGQKISSLHEKGSKGEGHKPSIKEGTQARLDEIQKHFDDWQKNWGQKGIGGKEESEQFRKELTESHHEIDSLAARLKDIKHLEKAGITDESHPTFQKIMKLRDEAENAYQKWRDSISYQDLKDEILNTRWKKKDDDKRRAAWRDYYKKEEESFNLMDAFKKADAKVSAHNPGTYFLDGIKPLAEPLKASPKSGYRIEMSTEHGELKGSETQAHHGRRYHTGDNDYLIGLHPDAAERLGVPLLKQGGHAHDSGILAYDRTGSVRTFDENGRLRVETTPISKANICAYWGKEIPDHERLGLDPKKSYRLLRDPEELAKAADTFNSLPVLEDHTPTSANAHPRELTVGATMDNARFEAPYLMVGMVIFDGPAIQRIQTGQQRELSCGYAYDADMTPGTYEGQPYDGRMVNIRGNHVALVEKGRAGPDVLVNDSAINKENTVEELEKALAATQKQLDAIKAAMRGGENKAATPEAEAHDDGAMQVMLAAMEKSMKDTGCSPDQIEDCLKACRDASGGGEASGKQGNDDGEETPATAPNSGAAPGEKEGEDEDEEEKERKREMATDEKIKNAIAADRAIRRAADDARRLVRPLVGDVHGMDSAAEVYRYALRQSGMAMDSMKGINEEGLKALVNAQLRSSRAAYEPVMAADSASLPYKAPRKL